MSNKTFPIDFNLNHQWKLYLERSQVKEETMPEDQRREMKRAFMGACSQLILLLRDELGDYGDKHGEEAAAYCMQHMLDQCGAFWEKEMETQSGKNN